MNREFELPSAVSLALMRTVLGAVLMSAGLGACGSNTAPSSVSPGDGGAGGPGASAAGSARAQSGSAGSGVANVSGAASGGVGVGAGGTREVGGSSGATGGTGGTGAGSNGSAGSSGSVSMAGASSNGGGAGSPPSACGLPDPVSFQQNIQGFVTSSCGKAVSGGCHVTDTSKTSLGYNHAYDWITAIAHPSSCGRTPPYAKRFEVVLAVINAANPPSCPSSRKMPPAGMGTPLTACQVAALTAWLAEPMVSQSHVPETDDTKDLYPAGPYLMPPFN